MKLPKKKPTSAPKKSEDLVFSILAPAPKSKVAKALDPFSNDLPEVDEEPPEEDLDQDGEDEEESQPPANGDLPVGARRPNRKIPPPPPPPPKKKNELVPSLDEIEPPVPGSRLASRKAGVPGQLAPVLNPESLPLDSPIPDRDSRKAAKKGVSSYRSEEIISLLEFEAHDAATTLMVKTISQTLINVLPALEERVASSNGAYGVQGLNMTISQIREMIADIKSSRDRSDIGITLIQRYIMPSVRNIAMQMSIAMNTMLSDAKKRMEKPDYQEYESLVMVLQNNLAGYMNDSLETLQTEIQKALN